MIILKSPDEIQKMRRSNMMVYEVLELLKEAARPGITPNDLNRLAEAQIRKQGGIPTFIGYMGYPKSLCVSVNDRVVHGIPDNIPFKEGDIVSLDCGVTYDGYVGDSAVTVPIGKVSPEVRGLLDATRNALYQGIDRMREGNRLHDIGHAIETVALGKGYGVVKEFVGHGIGRRMHEPPQVPNFGKPGTGARLKLGMVLAIEPMFNLGSAEVRVLEDGWTVVTKDGSLSAHFEHSAAITDKGPWILSQP